MVFVSPMSTHYLQQLLQFRFMRFEPFEEQILEAKVLFRTNPAAHPDLQPPFLFGRPISAPSGGELSPFGVKSGNILSFRLQPTVMYPRMRCSNEPFEQWVRLVGFAVDLGMKLARDKKGMLGQFDDFDQLAVRCEAAENEVLLFEPLAVRIVEFIA